MECPPVAEVPPLPERFSQTKLARFSQCARAGYFEVAFDAPASHPMMRGTVFHAFAERAARVMVERDEPRMDPDTAKDLLREVCAENPGWALRPEDMDVLRQMAYNWTAHYPMRLGDLVGLEVPVFMEVAGTRCSSRIDVIYRDGDTLRVDDYKTSLWVPGQEEFEAGFQLPFYACALAFGADEEGAVYGDGVRYFELSEVYPRYVDEAGRLVRRTVTLDRAYLDDQLSYLEGLVERVRALFDSGRFDPTPGSWCAICPLPQRCPLPAMWRPESDVAPGILAEYVRATDAQLARARKALRAHVAATGEGVEVGDLRFDFAPQSRTKVDREGMLLAFEQAAYNGERFDPSDWITDTVTTVFRARKVKR